MPVDGPPCARGHMPGHRQTPAASRPKRRYADSSCPNLHVAVPGVLGRLKGVWDAFARCLKAPESAEHRLNGDSNAVAGRINSFSGVDSPP
eukprot:103415-Alexandrium_andersonii.AAC.1